FFQAEDGIRDKLVTGVQTCALPISVMVLSCGALLERGDLIALAKARSGQILVPTGALLGLDAVTAAAEGQIHSVRMTTRKPPKRSEERRVGKECRGRGWAQ